MSKKTFWEAELEYKNNPFLPFWKKEELLKSMMSKTATELAQKDNILPQFSKNKFKK